MKRLKGPELKMPDLKVPTFFSDVYYDLRDRRLLPLVALVVVAIAAVPFLLGDPAEQPPPLAASGGAGTDAASASKLTVVEATPGLRDYRKRLSDRTPTDPFEQRYTEANLKGAELPPESGSGGDPGGGGEKAPKGGSEADGNGDEQADGGATVKPGDLVLYSFAINVKITRSGGADDESGESAQNSEPIVKKRVLPQTPLPGEKAPVVTYMGASKKMTSLDQPKVLLLVSPEVKSVFGDARCVSGSETCQLLEVEPGFPEVFVYGANEVRYTINILKAGLVVVGRR